MARPATSSDEVVRKAETVLDVFVPQVIEPRMRRLHALVAKFRALDMTPDVILDPTTDRAIRCAYEALQISVNHNKDRNDAAQDALMTLARSPPGTTVGG